MAALDCKKEFCRLLHVVEKLITESSDRETWQSELEALKNSAKKKVQEFVNWLNLPKEQEEIKLDYEEKFQFYKKKIFGDIPSFVMLHNFVSTMWRH